MADKYNRSRFFEKNVAHGTLECDLVSNSFADITFKRPFIFHYVKSEDLHRPDLLSFKYFGQVNLWWIIAKLNDIEDFFNDLEEGMILKIPAKTDIQEYYKENRKRLRTHE